MRKNLGHILGYATLTVILTAGAAQSLSGSNTVFSDDIVDGQIYGKDLANNAVSGSKVYNSSLTGADVAYDSLTGADINESTLNTAFSQIATLNCSTNMGVTKVCATIPITVLQAGILTTHNQVALDDANLVVDFDGNGLQPLERTFPTIGNHTLTLSIQPQCSNCVAMATATGKFGITFTPTK